MEAKQPKKRESKLASKTDKKIFQVVKTERAARKERSRTKSRQKNQPVPDKVE